MKLFKVLTRDETYCHPITQTDYELAEEPLEALELALGRLGYSVTVEELATYEKEVDST